MKKVTVDSVMDLKLRLSLPYTASFMAKSSFFYLCNAGHFLCNPGYYNKREGLQGYLLVYTLAGKGHAVIRGKTYQAVKGQVLLINNNEYHEYGTDQQELWEFKFFTFNGCSSDEYASIIYKAFGPVVHIPENGNILQSMEQFIDMIREHDSNIEIKASGMIVQILTEILIAGWPKKGDKLLDNGTKRMEASLEYIRNNYASDISVEDMAKPAYCSIHHFARIFKLSTGYSPYEYLIKYRITRAKALLKGSSAPIDEIAGDIGFDSTSNFIKTFRELEGMTPLKYRKMWWAE